VFRFCSLRFFFKFCVRPVQLFLHFDASLRFRVQRVSQALDFAFGAVVMIVGDTLVWPWLVGEQARLPFLVALIGIFGGLQSFGLVGLFIGPVLLAAFWIVLKEWLLKFRSGPV